MKRLTRPVRHAAAFLALRALVGLLRLLPTSASLLLGAGMGRLIGLFAWSDNRRMRQHLTHLDHPPSVSACWADLGRRFAEFALARRLVDAVQVTLPEPIPSGPIVVATTHLGNWELLAAALARDFPVHAIGARRQAGPIFRWLAEEREKLSVITYHPGQARAALRHLDHGVLALFVDQNTGERSRDIEFLGRPAPTPLTFERLRDLTGATPLFAYLVRTPQGYRGAVEPCPDLDAATARLEALVQAHPEQWVWQHRRWGRLPP